MITQEMIVLSTTNVLNHMQKHLFKCRDMLKEIEDPATSLSTKLQDVRSLKLHLDIIKSDADRALLIIGE